MIQSGSSPQTTGARSIDESDLSLCHLGAVIALCATWFIHFVEVPAAFTEATYKGLLFVANGVAALIAVGGIVRGV